MKEKRYNFKKYKAKSILAMGFISGIFIATILTNIVWIFTYYYSKDIKTVETIRLVPNPDCAYNEFIKRSDK